MDKIKIKKSPTADTRSAKEKVSKEQLLESSNQHITDVQNAMLWIRAKLFEIAQNHDWTKIQYIDEFHKDFSDVQENPKLDFKKLGWFERHVTTERHHVNDHCSEDINLFDLLERIADITTAGMARTGNIYDDTLSSEILIKAYTNTVKLIKENIEVEE